MRRPLIRPSERLIFLIALFSWPRYVSSLSLQRGGHGVADQTFARADALRAIDAGPPLCADAGGASLLEAAPPAQLDAAFGCGASGDARCVVLDARHLGRCVHVEALERPTDRHPALPEWRLGRVWLLMGAMLGYEVANAPRARVPPGMEHAALLADSLAGGLQSSSTLRLVGVLL